MGDWRIIKFDPFSHEVVSRNDKTGATVSTMVPVEHRTAEKAAEWLQEFHNKQPRPKPPEPITIIQVVTSNTFKYLFIGACVLVGIDACLRIYGI